MNVIKFQTTDEIIEQTKECYKKINTCLGDSGDIKCFFCPQCVLSLPKLIRNLEQAHEEVKASKPQTERAGATPACGIPASNTPKQIKCLQATGADAFLYNHLTLPRTYYNQIGCMALMGHCHASIHFNF